MVQFVSANYSPESKKEETLIVAMLLCQANRVAIRMTMEGISIFQAVPTVCRMLHSNANSQYNLKHSETNFGSKVEMIKGKAVHSEHPLLMQIRRGKRKLIEMKHTQRDSSIGSQFKVSINYN